jgi:hypothetical protein
MMMPRGYGLRGLGDGPGSCSNGGSWDQYLNVCCGPPGTPAMQDPCSILNNPAFIAQQNAEISQDIATAGPIEQPTLEALTSVPINIGNDAVYCQSNPGITFVDSMGVTITCPSASHTDVTTGGQPMSTYTTAQLASMLNAQYGSQSPNTSGNAAAVITAPAKVQPTQQQLSTVTPAVPVGPSTSPISTSGATSTSGAASTGSNGSTSTASSSGIDLSFLTDTSLISGVPNWIVGFGAIAALIILPGLIGGRR